MITMIVKGERRIGDHLARVLAQIWDIDLPELEQTLEGVLCPDSDTALSAALRLCRSELPASFLAKYEAQARRRTVDRSALAWLFDILAAYADWLAVSGAAPRSKRIPERNEPSGIRHIDDDGEAWEGAAASSRGEDSSRR